MAKEITNPVKAIRAKCIDCCGGQKAEVKLCVCEKCALYHFRTGKNPYTKRTMSDEQKAAAAERLKFAREKKDAKENING